MCKKLIFIIYVDMKRRGLIDEVELERPEREKTKKESKKRKPVSRECRQGNDYGDWAYTWCLLKQTMS